MSRRISILFALLALAVLPAQAQVPAIVKIGVLNDMNGPFADQPSRRSRSPVRRQMVQSDFRSAPSDS